MPNVVFPMDNTKSFTEQEIIGHNRWHPDIPAQVSVRPGDSFRVECREWFDGAIHNDDSAEDVLNAPLPGVHVLSGPIAVEGAEPGDLLIVDILDVGPVPQEDSGPYSGQGWGYTGVFATQNGGGFLTEQFPDAYKVIWDFRGRVATSRHIPGVSYTGIVHPGLMGTAPSARAAGQMERPRAGADRHQPEPGAAVGAAPATGLGDPGQPYRNGLRPGRRRGRPYRATAGERRQPGHQELHQGNPGVLPGVRRRGEAVHG